MREIPDDLILHGFSFAGDLSRMKMGEIHENLKNRDIDLQSVIFSAWGDSESDCTWVVAANKYLDDKEVRNTIEFILENNIEENYLLSSFDLP